MIVCILAMARKELQKVPAKRFPPGEPFTIMIMRGWKKDISRIIERKLEKLLL